MDNPLENGSSKKRLHLEKVIHPKKQSLLVYVFQLFSALKYNIL